MLECIVLPWGKVDQDVGHKAWKSVSYRHIFCFAT